MKISVININTVQKTFNTPQDGTANLVLLV